MNFLEISNESDGDYLQGRPLTERPARFFEVPAAQADHCVAGSLQTSRCKPSMLGCFEKISSCLLQNKLVLCSFDSLEDTSSFVLHMACVLGMMATGI